jgi:hypothetical protein
MHETHFHIYPIKMRRKTGIREEKIVKLFTYAHLEVLLLL